METNQVKSWYAVYTVSRSEKKVQKELQQKGFENFLPIQTVTRLWSDRKKKVEVPVISSYLFVHCVPTDFMHVRNVSGVAEFLTVGKRPTPISSQVIKDLQFLCENAEEAVEFTFETFAPGDRIKVVKGKLKGLCGELIERQGEYKMLVRLEGFGSVLTTVAVSCMKKIK